jgi:hypothetical protein
MAGSYGHTNKSWGHRRCPGAGGDALVVVVAVHAEEQQPRACASRGGQRDETSSCVK